jgi:hypothetical protein
MRTLTIVIAIAFVAIGAFSPTPASAEPTTTEIGAQAKKTAKVRDCSRVAGGFTGWRAREARRFCRMRQG